MKRPCSAAELYGINNNRIFLEKLLTKFTAYDTISTRPRYLLIIAARNAIIFAKKAALDLKNKIQIAQEGFI